jgi:serpin B
MGMVCAFRHGMHGKKRFSVWGWAALLGAGAVSCGDEGAGRAPQTPDDGGDRSEPPGGDGAGGAPQTTNDGDYRFEPPGVVKASAQSRELSPDVDGRDLTTLVSGNTEFALSMFERLRAQSPAQNMALGPYGISQAMAMLYAGARGQTAAEMREVLHFDVPPATLHSTFNGLDLELGSRNSDIVLRNANQTWLATGFTPNPEYLDVLTRDYGAPLVTLDFASDPESARGAINQWVADVTEQKIPTLFPVDTIQRETVLVLTNAMYMDAPWKYQFEPAQTRPAEFTMLDGTTAMVPTMHFDEFLPSAAGDGWVAVELPYRGDEVSMFVIVPDDLEQFETTLTSAVLDDVLGEIRDGGIHLSFPRFSYRFHASLIPAFEALGLASLFSTPDLSGIADGLRVAAIEHEAFVEVDEEGTRAAAATGVAIEGSHGPTITVDRPFLFFIVDKPTSTLMFMGRMVDPR